MYVLAYVDDLIIVSSSKLATTHLLQQLDHEFVIKDMDHLHYFLGIEVQASSSGLLLSQRTYIQELLTKTNMINCHPVSTPMSSSDKISKYDSNPLSSDDTTLYRSTVGALQYLMMTRPDISFAVNKVCQYMQQLTIEHWTTVKLSVSYAISSLPAMMVFASHGLHRSCSVHSLTWTGQDARMIVDQLEACLCSLVLT
jgi:hypothetical protein